MKIYQDTKNPSTYYCGSSYNYDALKDERMEYRPIIGKNGKVIRQDIYINGKKQKRNK